MNRREFFLKMIGAGAGLAIAAAVKPPKPDAVLEVELPEIEVEEAPFSMLTGLSVCHEEEVRIWRPQFRLVEQDIGAIFRPNV